MLFTIYLVTNTINNKRYVGITKKTSYKRWLQHKRDAKRGSRHYLHQAIRKYGASSFLVEDLANTFDQETTNRIEMVLIALFGTYGFRKPGYNQTAGGAGNRREWTEEERIKHKERQKASMNRPEVKAKLAPYLKGKPGLRRGKRNSAEHIARRKATSSKIYLLFEGELLDCGDWAKRVGLKRRTLLQRIYYGWSVKDALTIPVPVKPTRKIKIFQPTLFQEDEEEREKSEGGALVPRRSSGAETG